MSAKCPRDIAKRRETSSGVDEQKSSVKQFHIIAAGHRRA